MNLSFFSDRRIKQLEIESKLDDLLMIAIKECPATTGAFLLNLRRVNRDESIKIYQAPFYSMPSMFSAFIERVDTLQSRILSKSVCGLCKELETINSEITGK